MSTNDTASTPSRDEMRASIFSSDNTKLKRKLITFFGQKLELQQPAFGEILQTADDDDSDASKSAIVKALVDRCFIPGTDIKVFEETDVDALKSLPFDRNFTDLAKALDELSQLNPTSPAGE